MGRKCIKSLGKRRKYRNKKNKIEMILKRIFIIICILVCTVALYFTTKHIEELYKEKNIENSKVEYYMDIADEASDYNTQVNWKDIMAIEMAIHDGDLTQIKKKDSLDIARKFVIKEKNKNKNREYIYVVNEFNNVLEELKLNIEEKKKAINYKKELDNVYLLDTDLSNNSKQVVFINKIKNMAIENYHSYKILPSITIAQCILESGWGESELSKNSNNLFGIKADNRWDGKSIEVSTTENYDDKIVASFRVYSNIDDSIKDYGKFLYENKRYTVHGLFEAKHYTTQAQSLENAGYSTKKDDKGEPIYADILINLIRSYNLQLVDWEVQLRK